MGEIFLKVLNMSIAASWLIMAVVLLRLALKRAPKWIAVLLWGIVAVRLVVPFSFESALSLIPSAQTIPEKVMSGPSFDVQTGIAPVDDHISDYLGDRYFEGITAPVKNGANTMAVLSTLWVIGIVLLIVYTAVSYVRVRRSVAERVPYEGNIFLCDHVKSPFILGLVRPGIYLPSGMDAAAMEPVIAHEKAHLARRDHWWKPLGFLILTVYWFDPLCWIAYVLLCRDIELACDEKVIRQMDLDGKKQYSTALLERSTGRRLVTVCPLAFGEVGVKERVKNVLYYKKPAFWIIVLSAIICTIVAVCFLTDPVSKKMLEPIPPDSISQNVYNDLQHEWDSWNLLSQESKMVSSHLPGCCQRDFDDWAECEAFLGFSIPNPLEECTWLEQATYVAMPIGFRDAPRVKASWYGTEEGHIEWISAQGGYRDGDIRVIIDAMLYGDPADIKPSDRGWGIELVRKNYLENVDDAQLQISSEATSRYFSYTAYQAYGAILYHFQVIGNPDAQLQVENTLDQVIAAFSEEFDQRA